MKLIHAIVGDDDSGRVVQDLNKAGFRVTKLNTTGGFLRSGNTTLMICVEDEELETAISIIRKNSKRRQVKITGTMNPYLDVKEPVTVDVGGATIFVVNVEHFEKV